MDVLDKNASLVNSVREEELKAFDDTKLGVKGLVDAGMVNIPGIFVRLPDELSRELLYSRTHLQVPVIDLQGIGNSDLRKKIVTQVQQASEQWGFFQVGESWYSSECARGLEVNIGVIYSRLYQMITWKSSSPSDLMDRNYETFSNSEARLELKF